MSVDYLPAGRVPDLRLVAEPIEPERSLRGRLVDRLLHLPTLCFIGDLVAVLAAAAVVVPGSVVLIVGSFTLVAALGSTGLYRSRLSLSLLDDLPKLAMAWLAAGGVTLAGDQVVHGGRPQGLQFVIVMGVALVVDRGLTYWFARRLRSTAVLSKRCVVIGTTDYGRRITSILRERPEYGLRPVGFVDDVARNTPDLPVPVIGTVSDLPRLLEAESIHVAVLAYDNVPDNDLVALIRSCHRLRCELFLVPQFAELHSSNADTEVIWGMPIVRLKRAAHRTTSWRLKRVMDATIAGAALLALAPLMAYLTLAIRREGGPGVIFRQTRVGIDGREFELFKFRSMRPVDDTESATNWNISQDDRVGPVGKFIRRTSLDELPQLVNILRGDMSLVGPRPERPYFVRQFSSLYPSYQSRDRVPCGLTGWAQVHGLRGDTAIDERADFDNFYIENWSLWLDLKILLKTAVSVFRAPGS